MNDKTCETCRHYLGGGQCALSMEKECADGDRELWEAMKDAADRRGRAENGV